MSATEDMGSDSPIQSEGHAARSFSALFDASVNAVKGLMEVTKPMLAKAA